MYLFLNCCCSAGYLPDDGRPLSHEKRLIKDLLRDYRRRGVYGRPVYNYSESVKIEFGVQLIQIMDLDEKKQILTLNVWDHYVRMVYMYAQWRTPLVDVFIILHWMPLIIVICLYVIVAVIFSLIISQYWLQSSSLDIMTSFSSSALLRHRLFVSERNVDKMNYSR